MNNRIQTLLGKMSEKGIETLLITDEKNMFYYSGFYKGEGYLIIEKDRLCLVTDSRYTEYASNACPDFEVLDSAKCKLPELVSRERTVGFEDMSISYRLYSSFAKHLSHPVPVGDMTLSPREVKDEAEIASIKKAVAVADRAFAYVCPLIREGMTEKELAAELDCYMKRNGGEENSFSTVVAAGARGSLPHAIPTDRMLQKGDLVVMDFGCICDGYCSDMTRTVAVGDISPECRRIYDTVLSAQLASLEHIRAGVIAKDVDKVARDIIYREYEGCFGHALGHSVGLDIHESPNLSPKNDKAVCEGNVLTVEPGIYVPGLCGVRIEDMVVVTSDGCDILTASPKELLVVG